MNLNWKKVSFSGAIIALVGYFIVTGIHVQYASIRPHILHDNLITYDASITTVGYRTVSAARQLINVLMNKSGGYMSNDKLPPYSWVDDMPNWEYGVIEVLREYNIALRRHFTRSQTQSVEDTDAVEAMTSLNVDSEAWMFPSVEGWPWTTGQYVKSSEALHRLELRLLDDNPNDGNFYTRATSLAAFIDMSNRILGSHSQRLSASITKERLNIDMVGDKNAEEAKPQSYVNTNILTDWLLIDDIFWEAQGSVYALSVMFKAMEVDFYKVLEDKNALPSIRQIIIELDTAQGVVYSPLIINGVGLDSTPYGLGANYSLILANYISRASAALTDLKTLLEDG